MRFAVLVVSVLSFLVCVSTFAAEEWPPKIEPLVRTVDLNVGESSEVRLVDGSTANVKLLDLKENRDDLRQAVREARVTVEVNGTKAVLTACNYRLPITVGGVQIDCAVTQGFVQGKNNAWALDKDARLRLWPAGSPWIQPETFQLPLRQRWFATMTQMANEPTYVDGGESPANKSIYYHSGLDFGGAEGLDEVVAATDAVVVSAGEATIQPPDYPSAVRPRYDVVYLRDGRGWFYRYSHLHSIDPAMKPGAKVHKGQKVGLLGKEGASGGWTHLHFDITALQPSGRFGASEAYPFAWQAAMAEQKIPLQAVARPHHLTWTGEDVTLDGSLSWSAKGSKPIASYQWTFSDGATADGPKVVRRYAAPGEYCETLKVTDADGRVDYDFTVVQVHDRKQPGQMPPTIHAAYWPTLGLKAGDEITFKVRSFGLGMEATRERWDFGDGTPAVEVKSNEERTDPATGKSNALAKDGYAATTHRYAKPGHYLVTVSRSNDRGETATTRLHVRVDP